MFTSRIKGFPSNDTALVTDCVHTIKTGHIAYQSRDGKKSSGKYTAMYERISDVRRAEISM